MENKCVKLCSSLYLFAFLMISKAIASEIKNEHESEVGYSHTFYCCGSSHIATCETKEKQQLRKTTLP